MKETLCKNINFIVQHVFNACNTDEEFLDEMFKLVENDIDINFDSNFFYILDYKLIDSNKLFFPINVNSTPIGLLQMILDLVESNLMTENIKNKSYLIHFRVYKNKTELETLDNCIRRSAFKAIGNFMLRSDKVIIFLINKLTLIENVKQKTVQELTQIFRIKNILEALYENNST